MSGMGLANSHLGAWRLNCRRTVIIVNKVWCISPRFGYSAFGAPFRYKQLSHVAQGADSAVTMHRQLTRTVIESAARD
eukprot:SAG11_NODE_2221_length_3669_cov_7.764986_3_plen_78_part_00